MDLLQQIIISFIQTNNYILYNTLYLTFIYCIEYLNQCNFYFVITV